MFLEIDTCEILKNNQFMQNKNYQNINTNKINICNIYALL